MLVPFTLEDYDSAIEKIGSGLLRLGAVSSDSIDMKTFHGRLRPHELKTQLEGCFAVPFKNAEVSLILTET